MAITGTLTLRGVLSGLLAGTKRFSLQWNITNGVGAVSSPLNLASGDNTLTVPAGTSVIIFVPPAGNGNSLTLKGAAGDTGIALRPSMPTVITWSSGPVILNSAGVTNGCEVSFA